MRIASHQRAIIDCAPLLGLAETSHAASALATATFSNLRLGASFDDVVLQQP